MSYPTKLDFEKAFGPYDFHDKIATVVVASDTGGTLDIAILVDGDPADPSARWNPVITLSAGESTQLHLEHTTYRATPNGGAEYSWTDGK